MYILKKWNGKYGDAAMFIVKDKKTNKFCLFSPARVNDKTWVNQDLSSLPEYKKWEDFDNTEVDILENVMM